MVEKLNKPELFLAIEGGPLCGKTLFALSLFKDRVCHVDLCHLDHDVYKNQNSDIDVYRPGRQAEVVKFLQNNNYDTIILDGITSFGMTSKIFEIIFKYAKNNSTNKKYIFIFNNIEEKPKLLFKAMIPLFDTYLYFQKRGRIKFGEYEEYTSFSKTEIFTIFDTLKLEPKSGFLIDIENNRIIRTDDIITEHIDEGIITRSGTAYEVDGKRFKSYRDLFYYYVEQE